MVFTKDKLLDYLKLFQNVADEQLEEAKQNDSAEKLEFALQRWRVFHRDIPNFINMFLNANEKV